MKKCLLWIVFWVSMLVPLQGFGLAASPLQHLQPEEHQTLAARLVVGLLSQNHYSARPLDRSLATKVFDNYLQTLDPEKLFFTQADIDGFAAERGTLDDALRAGNVGLPYTVYDTYRERLSARFSYARELLKTVPDFGAKENLEFERRAAHWLRDEDEARELWRKRVKNDWLGLKLAGQQDEAIRKTLDKRYEGYLNRIARSKSEDVFQLFMDAYATTIDPHTNYFGPRASEEFDISMRLSLTGIGAVLQARDDYTAVRELVPGGPAARSGKLKVGDRIVGVAQGNDGAVTDVLGWRLDDVVALIRGAEDSVVVLDVLPEGVGVEGKHKQVALVRKKITIKQQEAKKSIIEVKDEGVVRRIGVITLPLFYEDFAGRRDGNKEFKSASRDVSRLLAELKKEKVEGLIVDLRNNGGGALTQAIELTGLFIDQGPVVQQRDGQGRIEVESDSSRGYAWGGPMAVLINRSSASASEIFAAAIQDYGRGLVLGETSFGKGTVQSVINLNQVLKSEKPGLGEVKLTIAEFFRINGSTTQLLGVKPDIPFPEFSDFKHLGESSFDNALQPTKIKPADYTPAGDLSVLVPQLRARHEARMGTDKDLKRVLQNAAEVASLRNRTTISLNEAERRAERDAIDARLNGLTDVAAAHGKPKPATAKGKTATAAQSASAASSGVSGEEGAEDDAVQKEKKAHEPDAVLLKESAHILVDELSLLAHNRKLAEKVLPRAAMLYSTP